MSRSEQGQERAHLEAFRESIEDFPSGRIPEDGKYSSPDFRVVSEAGVVGIEHTRIVKERGNRQVHPRARERYMLRVTRRAREIYRKRGNPSVSVWPSFTTNARLGKDNIELLAETLAEIVEKNLPDDKESLRVNQTWAPSDPLPRQLSSVKILRYGEPGAHQWFPPMGDFVPEVPTSLVAERIEKKNSNLPEYRSRCDEVWLLIVVDGGRPSSFFDVSGEALRKTYQPDFQRTYLLDFRNREAYRLDDGQKMCPR